jgi:uncharacterized caspase-like protein
MTENRMFSLHLLMMILGPVDNIQKHALIIGNDDYSRTDNRLTHSISNARKLGDILRKMKFTVTKHENVTEEDRMMEQVINFTKTFMNGDSVLCYFSGHALQFNGNNYLIPTYDTKVNSDQDVLVFGADIQRILDRLIENKPDCVFILILDCCRPYALNGGSATTSKFYYSYKVIKYMYISV